MGLDWNDPENGNNSEASKSQDKPAEKIPHEALQPVKASDKRVINGTSDINQLAPFKYPWAWNYFLNANKNHWSPTDVDLKQDVIDYNEKLSPAEKKLVTDVVSYLTTSDIQAMRNIGLAVMEKMTAPELQIYQARQMYEKSLHTWAFQYFIEQIGIAEDIYNRYRVIPEIHQKVEATNQYLKPVMQPDLDLNDSESLNQFMQSYAFFSGVFEGCWIYNAFIPIFTLQNRGLMQGLAQLCQYIFRDLTMHIDFGTQVLRSIQEETGFKWNQQKNADLWQLCYELEQAYIERLLEQPVSDMSTSDYLNHFRHVANRRALSMGMTPPFDEQTDAFPWLDKKASIGREETDSSSHEIQSSGSLSWD
ncbi:ribonucleotide-diphosphate reductase subunit beta [Marinicella sp. W31]|uniref:ribonucleotide-diphosphate reductase subunit beta n=1 Tax=Marinicella sp. W31 TaxID=3023713 RepID=UPI0037579308